MQPSDSLPPSATAPVPLAMTYPDAGACSAPPGPTTRAPDNVSCVGDHSPALRKTGISSRRGEGLPGFWAVLFVRALVEHPAGYAPRLAHLRRGHGGLRCTTTLSASGKKVDFGAAIPQPARSHTYASPIPFLGLAQGLLLAQAGSPLARPDSHRLDDRQSFMETSHPPIPFDQPCLVALLLNPSVMPLV